jgi:hypothetical protein
MFPFHLCDVLVRYLRVAYPFPDWTYLFFPTLAVYRMPYPELVTQLRKALNSLYEKGTLLEQGWQHREQAREPATGPASTVLRNLKLHIERRGQAKERIPGTPSSVPIPAFRDDFEFEPVAPRSSFNDQGSPRVSARHNRTSCGISGPDFHSTSPRPSIAKLKIHLQLRNCASAHASQP